MDVEKKIIDLLMEERGNFVSGEALARITGLSRTAVWKRIKALQKRYGYPIESQPSLGYRLREDYIPLDDLVPIISQESKLIGHPLFIYQRVTSTNDIAYSMAIEGAREGTTIVADSQEKGRGRLGRKWESPPGVNLYMSVILRPPIPPFKAHQVVFVSAVALAEAMRKVCDLKPQIKWPNDLLIDGKKVAGILTEMNAEPDRVNFIILGIGVNINMKKGMFPEGLMNIATSLREETGRVIDRARFAAILIYELERHYHLLLKKGFVPILKRWKEHSVLEGREVEVVHLSGTLRGVVLGVDSNGALLVRYKGGIEKILSGDVTILKGWK